LLLELEHLVLETRAAPGILDEVGQAESAPVDLGKALNVGQIRREPLQSELLRQLLAILAAVVRIVVIGDTPANLVQKIRPDLRLKDTLAPWSSRSLLMRPRVGR